MGYVNKLRKQITFRRIFNNEKNISCIIISYRTRRCSGNAGHDAHASETTNVDKAELAQKALTNDQSLNESPVQEGAYNINFDYNGNSYHFESDGSTWSWSYESTNNATQPVQQANLK